MQTSPISPLHGPSRPPTDRLAPSTAAPRRATPEQPPPDPTATQPVNPAANAPGPTEDSLELGTSTAPATPYPRPNPSAEPPPLHDRFSDLERRASAMTPTLLSIMVRARYEPYTHGGLNE